MENKKYEIIWSPKAYRNIQKIYAFTLEKLGNERYAIKIVKKILKAINSLRLFPFMYPKIYIDRKFKRQLRRATVGKYAGNIMAFPTTVLVDKDGNIIGEPFMGGIDDQSNYDQLMKQIQSVLDQK